MKEQTYERLDLAREQLEVAIELFLARRSYVSAITLAGASEEIFGRALQSNGLKTTLEHEHSIISPIEEWLRKTGYSLHDFVAEKNRVRNAAKHMNDKSEPTILADLESEAIRMIVRACDNHHRLSNTPTPAIENFNNWFWINVVGLE